MTTNHELPADLDNLIAGLRIENINLKLAAKQADALLRITYEHGRYRRLSDDELLQIGEFLASQQGEQRSDFRKHLKDCADEVATWPAYKRESLGVIINGHQLRNALEFLAPDNSPEQLSEDLVIELHAKDEDFPEAGLYAYHSECPEEGAIFLDDTAQHPEQAEGAQGERKLSDLGNELHNLSCAVIHTNEDWAGQISSIAGELWKWPDRAALAQPSPAPELDPLGLAPHAAAFNEAPAEALKAAPELERPEVVAWLVVAKYPHKETRRAIFLYEANADDQGAEWCCDDGVVTISPLIDRAFVSQHARIAAVRVAEIEELDGLVKRLGDLLSQVAIVLRGPEPALTRYGYADLPQRVKALMDERDAAQTKVTELSSTAREAVDYLDSNSMNQIGSGSKLHRALSDALKADPVAKAGQVPAIPQQWAKSLSCCWPKYLDDKDGDWCIGTIDEDGNLYEVLLVEASQYDAAGESQKIAEAIVSLWSFAAAPAQGGE